MSGFSEYEMQEAFCKYQKIFTAKKIKTEVPYFARNIDIVVLDKNNNIISIEAKLNDVKKVINALKPTHEKLKEIILSYLAQGSIYLTSGTMAESTAYSEMITGFKWTSKGTAFVYTGTMAEVSAIAVMEA